MRYRRPNEQGFILITAIWLILLCATIVAVLMLRGHERAITAADADERLAMQLRLESAIESVIADVLFNGAASPWSDLPSTRSLTLGGGNVAVKVTSENGRLDLNDIELSTLDTALRGFGVSALTRDEIAAALAIRRKAKSRFAAWADVERLLATASAEVGDKLCLHEEVTLYSGLTEPDTRFMSPTLSQFLGGVPQSGDGLKIEPGSAVRIVATAESGLAMTAIIRITGLLDRPYEMMRLDNRSSCARPVNSSKVGKTAPASDG